MTLREHQIDRLRTGARCDEISEPDRKAGAARADQLERMSDAEYDALYSYPATGETL